MITWPVAVSEGVARLWLLPLFGHSIASPNEAAASVTITNGEKVLWPERLSSCTIRTVLPCAEAWPASNRPAMSALILKNDFIGITLHEPYFY
jgi:hypothetical protein